ncbi:glutamine--fructose-6-phosphate transaminase (isomerizing) [Natronococcus sp. JC468]|uniref:glutamine--fructose-6-phosphate transaminase (isomerizing) n=1 Tax=Natronococcus sp. JC468 TaxID=1961921 RepID=UPI001439D982|nr:glutamine--fructose-6-phosphate transaminase (isomerizing) [Natronococcus sp. JC468]NKE37030.1 glutamine--fructose-6-phosphate transaminase (isomerizing) [Natronococcus sp. JC468]
MCGIIGYASARDDRPVLEVLSNGLSRLEYRGYDSAGVALAAPEVSVYKREGEVAALEELLPDAPVDALAGIGHTRWSTHGPPTDENAHPHTDCRDRVAVVHNGIVENYRELRAELEAAGHAFDSETDTEVIPHLIGAALAGGADADAAFRRAIDRLEGSYAVAAVFRDREEVYATRHRSPLVLGVDDRCALLASDVPAFLEYTDEVVYLEDGQFATIGPTGVEVRDRRGAPVDVSVETVDWNLEDAGKSGYEHYTLKEIHEQPRAVRQCLRGRPQPFEGSISIEDLEDVPRPTEVQFAACGTSYHASLYAARLFRERGVRATAFLASEYDAAAVPTDEGTLVVGVTQSGETADTLRALRTANAVGARTLAVTNVVGSSAARETDRVMYVRAGPEIGVAATKTFTSQQVALAMLSSALTGDRSGEFVAALRALPDRIQSILDDSRAREIAAEYVGSDAYFFVGRGLAHPVALEGALKTKELTYEHAEGFAAGELKHGPLALVTPETPVIALVSGRANTERMLGTITEVRARGAPVVAVTDDPESVERRVDRVLRVPETHWRFFPILANVQLQLLAYWVANGLGRSIDKPRNLAKSVTVE